MFKPALPLLYLTVAVLLPGSAVADESGTAPGEIQVSQELRDLLWAEMQEVAAASQAIPMYLATGDWLSVQRAGEQLRATYVMQKSLSEAQREELREKLPGQFKQLDLEFHERATKLAAAAADKDPELIAFHYYRMLETCVACHSAFATSRFPGFSAGMEEAGEAHRH